MCSSARSGRYLVSHFLASQFPVSLSRLDKVVVRAWKCRSYVLRKVRALLCSTKFIVFALVQDFPCQLVILLIFFFAFSKNRTNRGQVTSKKFARSVLSSVYTRLLIAIEAFWNFSRFRTRAYSFIPLFTILFVAATLVFFLKIGKVEKIISSYF